MAITTSQIELAITNIESRLVEQEAVIDKAAQNGVLASTSLAAIPADFAAEIAAINALGTTNAWEAVTKAKYAKLVTEFQAAKARADAIAGS